MPRIKIEFSKPPLFSTEIAVRISDINYGGHLGNDSVLSLIHESRVRFLASLGYSEKNIEGTGIIMGDVAIVYRNEAFYGDQIKIEIAVEDAQRKSCDFLYRLINSKTGKEIALAKTGIVFYDYECRKIQDIPIAFLKQIEEMISNTT